MFLVRLLKALFKGRPRSGYSIKGFWGQIKHFNKDGIQIGYTVKGFWGQRKRYDMNGNLISVSWRNFWGGYNTYDANGNLIRRSRKNFWGGYNTYDRSGKKIQESYRNFWEGMNHYDVENSAPYETYIVEKRASSPKTERSKSGVSKPQNSSGKGISGNVHIAESKKQTKQSDVYASEPKVAACEERASGSRTSVSNSYSESVQEKEAVKLPREDEHTGVDVVSYSESIGGREQHANNQVRYCQSVEEYVKSKEITQYAKLLVFRYKKLVEFPAIAHVCGSKVKVEPLLVGADAFEFACAELEHAKEEHVTDIDMSVLDNEFLSCCMSGLEKEFEELLPEYPFGSDSVYRTQYVFDCGMIITEKSMIELRKLCSK